MAEREWLAERFEANRGHLRGVAYRMLGSASEADDAVQEAWLRFSRSAPIVGRSEASARQLASRARRRVRGAAPVSRAELVRQRAVVEAFLAAARAGDFEALVAVLHPEVVRRIHAAGMSSPREVRGATVVARNALAGARNAREVPAALALVDGAVGVIVAPGGRLTTVLRFKVEGDKVVEIDVITAPDLLRELELALLEA